MNKLLYIAIIICSTIQLFGQQQGRKSRGGQVSFITSQNVYVKFTSTENIQKGDTLYIKKDEKLTPVLIVDQLSSISCICKPIGQSQLKVSDEIVAFISENQKKVINEVPAAAAVVGVKTVNSDSTVQVVTKPIVKKEQLIQGRLSLASYSNLTNVSGGSNTRFRYTLQMNIANPIKSKLAAESYMTYTHNTQSVPNTNNFDFNNLKIYSLAIKYNVNDKIGLWLGRKINPKISNVGAVDGLQIEINTGNFYVGAIGGTRPDYFNYSFNSNLFEYGAFVGHRSVSQEGLSVSSTVAFFEQNNSGKTDRRFAYFQHDNNLLKNLNLFISGEVDLYKVENGKPLSTFSLTSFYLSLRYKISRKLSLFGSYDERKNVIYYETFKSYLDQLLEKATRQGMQFRINYRPSELLMVNISAGHQFRTKDVRSTDNINGYLVFNKAPLINGPATFSANVIKTGYLNGKMAGLKINENLFKSKLYSGLGYQFVDYQIISSDTKLRQHIVSLDLSWYINRKLSFSVYCEKTFEQPVSNTRLFVNLIKRF